MTLAVSLVATAVGIAALTGATPTPSPAPDATSTVTVFSENVSNLVTAEPNPTSERVTTLHEGAVLQLLDTTPTEGAWGTVWHVALDDGRTGYLSTKVAIVTPTVTLNDLTQASMIVDPAAGTTWLGEMAAGSSNAYLYPTTMASKVGQPTLGETLKCAPEPVTGTAGVLGDVSFQACVVNDTLSYIRAEHVAPTVSLSDVEFTGTKTTVTTVPVFENPAAGADTVPVATLAEGVEVETGAPVSGFTPVRVGDDEGWAPTNVLLNVETWTDKLKDKATEVWGSVKETAGEAKDKVEEKLDERENTPTVIDQVRDIPGLILSLILTIVTLALAWTRKVSIFKLPTFARRALNVAATIPLVILASVAPMSYAWMLPVVLGVALAVSAGIFTGFRPDLSRFATTIRERKTQIIVGASALVGSITGALVTGFSGWLAPVVTGALALAAALGYALSSPDETPIEDEPTRGDDSAETAPEEVSA